MKVNIRKAKRKDMPQVLELIKELAVFEKEPDAVEVTVADLETEGFDKNLFTCFIAEVETNIVGIALVYFRFSTWKGRTVHLEDLVVSESYRSKGIGNLLFRRVMSYARAQGVRRAEWIVLNWNKEAIAMYEKNNADFHKDWWLVEMNEQELNKFNL